jgi:RHS repeat-associated protein
LPDTIQFTAGHQNYYTYDASGKKLEVQNITSRNILNLPQDTITRLVSSTKLTTDYCGDAIYQNDTLKEVLTPEGYWQNGLYYYYLKDHQGSTREVLRQDNTVMEYSDYYPDGMRFESSTSNSAALPYRYNGKELEAMNGLNEYDYGARRRETGIPVWTTVDPLCEKYYGVSPYAFCAGNPVNRIDPDGRWVASVFLQGSIGVGLGYGMYAVQQTGIAYDKYGTSHFQMTGTAHITNQNLRGSAKNQNVVWGAEAGISAGASIDWKSNSFVESLSGSSQASVPGPKIKGSVGVGISVNENSLALSAGLQAGASINSINMKVDESVSLTKSEASKVSNMTDVVTESWTVRNTTAIKDENGNITGYTGTVSTKNTNGEYVNTGIQVNCGTVKKENEILPNNTWMSNGYQKAINGN